MVRLVKCDCKSRSSGEFDQMIEAQLLDLDLNEIIILQDLMILMITMTMTMMSSQKARALPEAKYLHV